MPTDAPPAAPSRVWLADDSPLEVEHTLGLLSRAGYQLEAHADGASLLERLAQPDVTPPDLLLLDLHMPGVSGLEVCRFLRERFLPTELPILVLTGSRDERALEEAFGAGANDYVVKPARPVELLARVRTLLQARRDAEALRARERERERLLSDAQAARAEMDAERRRLATILGTLQEGVLLQDASGAVRFSNAATERLLGLSAEQREGLSPADPRWEAVRPDGSPVPAEEFPSLHVLRTGQRVTGDVLGVRHTDGRRVWLSIHAQPLFEQDGATPTGVVVSFVDVTAQHAADAERERLLGEVEAARVRLTSLFENAPAIICTFRGPELVYELSNPLHQRLVGKGRQLVGRPVRDAVPEAVDQGVVALLERVYRTGEPYFDRELSLRLDRQGDGTLVDAFVNVVYQPARDAAGQVVGVDVFGFEVTEQVLARQQVEALAQKLHQSEERLRRVVEASGTGTWEMDAATEMLVADAHFRELFGLSPEEPFPLAKGLSLIHPDESPRVARSIAAALAGGNGGRYREEYRTVRLPDGRWRWVEVRGQAVFGLDGKSTHMLGTGVDVTARKEAEAAREDLLDALSAQPFAGVVLFRGSEPRFERANAAYRRLVGGRDVEGKPLLEALPELAGQGFDTLLHEVQHTGTPAVMRETLARVDRSGKGVMEDGYYDFVFQPVGAPGGASPDVLQLVFDVTDLVRARQRAESLAEERRQLLEFLEHGDPCAVLDTHENFVFVNANYEKLTRRTREELLGKNHWEMFPAARGIAYEAQVRRVMQERVPVEFEEYYAPLDLWTAVTAYPTRAGGVALFARDVSARRRAEAQVAKLAAVVEESPDFIGICQLDGTGVFVNRAGQRLLGLKGAGDEARTHLSDFFVPEDLPAVAAAQEQALREGSSRGELRFRHFETGEAIPILWNIVTIKDPKSGEPIALATVSRDLREQKQREAEAQRREDFEQQLIGIVSHDLRNPLSAIIMSAATLLRRPDLEERQRRPIGRILASAERAIRMIRDLLDFTQARLGGGIPLSRAPVDLHALTRQVVDEVQVTQPERTVEVAHEGDGHGTWDSDRLAQVLGNLLSNALHYSPPNTPVRVLTRGEADVVVLEVHNRGTPISAEQLARLFQPMQRGLEQGASSGRSVGLGLYIVDQVVRAHGGSVEVSSTAEAGTAFTVRLPRGGGAPSAS